MYNILVVEDDRNTNQVICEFLKDSGYNVTASFDGESAIFLYSFNRFFYLGKGIKTHCSLWYVLLRAALRSLLLVGSFLVCLYYSWVTYLLNSTHNEPLNL